MSFAVVTESWFVKGHKLDDFKSTALQEHGLVVIDRNRPRMKSSNPGGGVAIVCNTKKITLKEHPVKRGKHEFIVASGKIHGNSRPLYVIATYLSTRLKAEEYHNHLAHLNAAILRIKTDVVNPYIILAGGFNRTDIQEAIGDYGDISIIHTGSTRSNATLDICATNFSEEIIEVLNHAPLEDHHGNQSDHNFVTYRFALQHRHNFTWLWAKSRKITDASEAAFSEELESVDWPTLLPPIFDIDQTTRAFHDVLLSLTNKHFPLYHYKYRSTDDPWIDEKTRDMIDKRKHLFARTNKRCYKWKKNKGTAAYQLGNTSSRTITEVKQR